MKILSELERKILDLLQKDYPITARPYKQMAEQANISEEEFLIIVKQLKDSGVIRRIGGVMDSRQLGFYSTLCASSVSPENIETVKERINTEPGVTHNYLRDHDLNIWFTLTARDYDGAMNIIRNIEKETGIKVYQFPAKTVYKIKVAFEMGLKNDI